MEWLFILLVAQLIYEQIKKNKYSDNSRQHGMVDLPDNLIQDIKSERMISSLLNMACPDMDYKDLVGDAEVVGYLMPATGRSPLRSQEAKYIYIVSARLLKRKSIEFKEGVEELSEYQMQRLNELKNGYLKNEEGKENNPIISALNEVFFKN